MPSNDRYVICVNQPGCLPEIDPYEVTGLEEARRALHDELEDTAGAHGIALATEMAAQLEVKDIGPAGGSVTLGGYVHEIAPAMAPWGVGTKEGGS